MPYGRHDEARRDVSSSFEHVTRITCVVHVVPVVPVVHVAPVVHIQENALVPCPTHRRHQALRPAGRPVPHRARPGLPHRPPRRAARGRRGQRVRQVHPAAAPRRPGGPDDGSVDVEAPGGLGHLAQTLDLPGRHRRGRRRPRARRGAGARAGRPGRRGGPRRDRRPRRVRPAARRPRGPGRCRGRPAGGDDAAQARGAAAARPRPAPRDALRRTALPARPRRRARRRARAAAARRAHQRPRRRGRGLAGGAAARPPGHGRRRLPRPRLPRPGRHRRPGGRRGPPHPAPLRQRLRGLPGRVGGRTGAQSKGVRGVEGRTRPVHGPRGHPHRPVLGDPRKAPAAFSGAGAFRPGRGRTAP